MYGLPAGFDGSQLIGRTLEQVCFTVNTVSLSFDNEVLITIESCFAHVQGQFVAGAERVHVPVVSSRLMQLAGESITGVRTARDGTLTMTFSNGDMLSCFDDSPAYEAYRIRIGKTEIVV